jgi:hypothetical protein
VSEALGKGETALGKAFAECNTRQRITAKMLTVKPALPSALVTLGKNLMPSTGQVTPFFLCRVQHSAKSFIF